MRITAFFMLVCTAAWIGVSMYFGLTQWVGIGFLITLVAYAIIAWSIDRDDATEDTREELKMMHTPMWRMVMLILIGIVGLPLGSRLLVDGGISLGHELGASETIVGLTLLAVGSSIPELGASVAAAVRKQSDVAMGNIIGANIFNILGAGGVVSILAPRAHISPEFTAFSNWIMIGAALLLTLPPGAPPLQMLAATGSGRSSSSFALQCSTSGSNSARDALSVVRMKPISRSSISWARSGSTPISTHARRCEIW